MNTEKEKPTLTAAQRLDALEAALKFVDEHVNNLYTQVETMRQALKLINNMSTSLVELLTQNQPVTEQNLEKKMVANSVEELKQTAQAMVEQKIIAPSEIVDKNSFLAVKETNAKTGQPIQLRAQFALAEMDEKTSSLFIGKKAGDVVSVSDGSVVVEILEVYDIVKGAAPQAS